MLKNILPLILLIISSHLIAQNISPAAIYLSKETNVEALTRSGDSRGSGIINCKDTVLYTIAKASSYRGINVFDSSATELSQWYYSAQPVTISGFEFYGYENDPSTSNSIDVTCKISTATGTFLPDQVLASTVVSVNSGTTSSEPAPFNRRRVAIFNTPVTVTGAFVLSVAAPGPYMVVIMTNNWDTQDGRSDFYNGAKIGNNWYQGNNVNVGGVPFNADVLINPYVSYQVNATMTKDKSCIEDSTVVTFSHLASEFFDSKFLNQNAFNDSLHLSFQWDMGDGTVKNQKNIGSHMYISKGKYIISLSDSLVGWRNNCVIVFKDSVDQHPTADFDISIDGNKLLINNNSVGADETLWDFGDGTYSASTAPTYHYVNGGTYDVTLIVKNSCTSDTLTKQATVFSVGTADINDLKNIQIYPNPVNDILYLDLPVSSLAVNAEVYNILGEKIMEKEMTGPGQYLDMSDLRPGTYIIKLNRGNDQIIRKVMKK